MKYDIRKTLCAVLAVILVCVTVTSCGKKEPKDSMIASETYTEVTVPSMPEEEVVALIREAIGDPDWDGDYASLTQVQITKIKQAFSKKGYTVSVSKDGIAYYDYVPTADKEEIAEVVAEVAPDKEWDGKFSSLTDNEKVAVQKQLQKRGYDVEVGSSGFEFKNEVARKQETTRAEYNQLPNKETLAGTLADVLGMEGYKNWDGNFKSLTKEEQADLLGQLNDYGYDLDINEQGEMYISHAPENTLTFDTAYSASPRDGTTAPQTTIVLPENESTTKQEPPTGTEPSKTYEARQLERSFVKTFGGSGSDLFNQILPTKDGGYIALMSTDSKDGDLAGADASWKIYFAAVIKFNKNFEVEWKDMLGNSGSSAGLYLEQAAQLNDGSIIVVGYSMNTNSSTYNGAEALMVKYTADGKQVFKKLLQGSSDDSFESVAAMADGGFVVGGRSKSGDGDFEGLMPDTNKAILARYTADGDNIWMRALKGGAGATHFVALGVTDAGAIYAACQASGTVQLDAAALSGLGGSAGIVVKYNSDGEMISHRAIDGSGADRINCMTLCSDGGVLVGGACSANDHDQSLFYGQTNRGSMDAYLVRLDAYLNVEWVKTFGGTGLDEIFAVAEIDDGFVAAGESASANGFFSDLGAGKTDAFMLSVSRNGTEAKIHALNGSEIDRARTVAFKGKQVLVAGATNSNDGVFTALSPASNGTARIGYIAGYKFN